MGRTRITEEQRIADLFMEMEVDQQAALLDELRKHHLFCKKRDRVISNYLSRQATKQVPDAEIAQRLAEAAAKEADRKWAEVDPPF